MSTPNPGFQDIDLSQARQAYDAGDFATAAREATRLLQQHPGDYRVLEFAAAVALVERRFQDSEQLLNRALGATTRPQEEAIVWSALGRLGRAVNNLDSAEESYRRAMLLDPAHLDHTLEFAYILATRGKLDPAIDVLRGAITRHPRDPQPCVALGNILTRANRQRDALAFYDMALQRDPNLAAAHFNAGVALTMLGKLDAAKTACETGLKLDPNLPGYYHLASLGALKPGDAAVTHLEEILRTPSASAEARIDAGYALARVYDDAGDAARAFPPLKQASAMKRATLRYDIANDEDRTDKVIAFFTRDFFERYAGVSDSKLAPVFILGMPRSGTTLVEQMLAGHSQVQGGGELPYMMDIAKRLGDTWGGRGAAAPGSADEVRADLRAAIESYTRQTAQLHARRPRFTDKLPGNFLFIGLIHLMFPEARIIHCRRDPVDTCLSCYQRLFSSDVPYSYDLTELGRYHRLYQRLMDHWRAVLPPGRILDVDYESVVAEPEREVRRMLEFCGLPFEPGCL
ncbi:MAG TPA: sulfotransferase, partial [Gammaproteobacteria bacterium]|nr:sulfotransferase [Gammaproteobacteria bacterium]